VLRHAGYHVGRSEAGAVKIIAAHESGDNPGAVNNWDSNAAAGTPSEGLMQTIGPTFHTYKLRGHGNMLNPVSDIIAAYRYAVDRYGSVNNVPGVQAVRAGGAYVGY
jgi:SLT domain-containing protein